MSLVLTKLQRSVLALLDHEGELPTGVETSTATDPAQVSGVTAESLRSRGMVELDTDRDGHKVARITPQGREALDVNPQ